MGHPVAVDDGLLQGIAVGGAYFLLSDAAVIFDPTPHLTLPTHLDKQQGDMTESRTGNRQIPFDILEELSSYPYHIVFAPKGWLRMNFPCNFLKARELPSFSEMIGRDENG